MKASEISRQTSMPPAQGGVGDSPVHESAHLHVSGSATYIDDIAEARGTLHAALGLSTRAHARILHLDLEPVRRAPGVVAVLQATDIPGLNNFGPILQDDPILAPGLVQCVGQPIFAVAATTVEQARRAARLARIEYQDLPAIFDTDSAIRAGSFVLPSMRLAQGDAAAALADAPQRLGGRFVIGAQEQFYLEGQIAYALPREDGQMLVHNSTQHPGEVQYQVAHALGIEAHRVVVECRRMGGGFGGKESQAALFACVAALLAQATGRPVKYRADRDDDMLITGKRHDFTVDYKAGFDQSGLLLGLDLALASRCGYSADLSGPVNDRAMTHADNCYVLENIEIISHRCKTNMQSATAFRGFGGPQGMLATEQVLDEIARHLGMDALDVRRRNFYQPGVRDVTHYGQKLEDFIMPALFDALEQSSDYRARRQQINAWNASQPVIRRGLAITPVKFGISFTSTMLNQAGALVNVYTDGTVLLNHGGTEMGQGLFTKVAQIVAEVFAIDLSRVRSTASDTARVPNASATAASSGADLNGKAAQAAALEIRNRMRDFAASHFSVDLADVRFTGNMVQAGAQQVSFAALAKLCWMHRVSLSATGYYRTPKIAYDAQTLRGRPFFYFAYGAAVAEVAIDTLTGESRLLRADILHDVGRSLNPALDRGQIEGGFVQGMGWLTSEALVWHPQTGRLLTHSPSTYKIPVAGDVPADFRVQLWQEGENHEDTVFRSKAVGEPPLMLAMSVFFAIKDAIASVAGPGSRLSPRLDAPATPEAILMAVQELRQRAAL